MRILWFAKQISSFLFLFPHPRVPSHNGGPQCGQLKPRTLIFQYFWAYILHFCELPEILQLNPAYIHSSAFRIKSMISSNERSLSTYASYNACFALSIFRFGCRSSSSVESSSARTLYSFCNNGIGCQVKHEAIFSSGCSASGKYFLKFFNPTFDWNILKYRFPFRQNRSVP